jgi:hypothetical protein
MSSSTLGLTKLLENRFRQYMDFGNLQLIGTAQDKYIVRDSAYQIESYHDFPVTADLSWWHHPYPAFIEKTNRRVARFLSTLKNGPVCFIRFQSTKSEAQELDRALSKITPHRYQLLIVNLHRDARNDIVYEDWGLNRISSVTIPAGTDWRGSNQAWDTIMKGFIRK